MVVWNAGPKAFVQRLTKENAEFVFGYAIPDTPSWPHCNRRQLRNLNRMFSAVDRQVQIGWVFALSRRNTARLAQELDEAITYEGFFWPQCHRSLSPEKHNYRVYCKDSGSVLA